MEGDKHGWQIGRAWPTSAPGTPHRRMDRGGGIGGTGLDGARVDHGIDDVHADIETVVNC